MKTGNLAINSRLTDIAMKQSNFGLGEKGIVNRITTQKLDFKGPPQGYQATSIDA